MPFAQRLLIWTGEQSVVSITRHFFTKHQKAVPLNGLLAWISVNIGLTHRTALAYLEDICQLKGWKLDEEKGVLRDLDMEFELEGKKAKEEKGEDKKK
jgi:hypothetical protein